MAVRYLIDTNVLIRLAQQEYPQHQLANSAIRELEKRDVKLCFSMQNIAELWNVCTRLENRNGYGLTPAETNRRTEAIEAKMTFLPDNEQVYSIWRRLVLNLNIRGVQVHDARLAAIMEAHAISYILTLNQEDFRRFPHVTAVHPNQVLA
jgi:predicted nucleic acid-binding protein